MVWLTGQLSEGGLVSQLAFQTCGQSDSERDRELCDCPPALPAGKCSFPSDACDDFFSPSRVFKRIVCLNVVVICLLKRQISCCGSAKINALYCVILCCVLLCFSMLCCNA